jgi:hypothetical protein
MHNSNIAPDKILSNYTEKNQPDFKVFQNAYSSQWNFFDIPRNYSAKIHPGLHKKRKGPQIWKQ